MANEIQKTEPNELQQIDPASPAGIMIQLASSGSDFDVEKFGKMLEYQERHEANIAKKVFAADFTMVQSKIAAVVKTKNNPQTNSKYAGLDDVLETSKPVYTEQGFSIIFYEGKADDAENIRVCADVLHKAGHKETYHIDVPLGGVGIKGTVNMTKIHGKATSITYGRRYLMCMIWNIPTQDDDGNSAGAPPKPQKPEGEEIDAISKICTKLNKLLPETMVADENKVAGMFFAGRGFYPKLNQVKAATEWLIGLKQDDRWAVPRKFKDGLVDKSRTSDEVFEGYEKALGPTVDDRDYIDREKFNVAAEDCIVEPDDNLVEWAIKNIPLAKVIEKRPF